MRFASVLLAASCLLSAVSAQWPETTILLRDSSGPVALCYNRQNNKVYCANWYDDNVTVIDGGTNQVLRTVGVGGGPRDFRHSPQQNQVYVANHLGSSISVLRDSGGGIGETMNAEVRTTSAPTTVREILFLNGLGTQSQSPGRDWVMSRAVLLDISGRAVMSLHPGANDIRHLASGVYFVRSEPSAVSREPSAVTKVVVQR
jgi:YVTN family beta-propeller protein